MLKPISWLAFLCWGAGSLAFAETSLQLSDPTRPQNYIATKNTEGLSSDKSTNNLILTAVLYSSKRHVAIINQRLLNVGDTIAGFEVETIRPNEVILKGSNTVVRIPLLQNKVKQLSTRK